MVVKKTFGYYIYIFRNNLIFTYLLNLLYLFKYCYGIKNF